MNVTTCPPLNEALVGLVIVIHGGVLIGTSPAGEAFRSSPSSWPLAGVRDAARSPVDDRAAADWVARVGLPFPVAGV